MNRRRHGSVLVLVIVIVFAISFMVLALGKQVRTSALTSANDVAAAKADAAARGAEQYVLSMLTDYRDTLDTMSETDFSAVAVGDSYFWVVRPDYDDATLHTWGIVDESGKLPLNTATQTQLIALPGMTDEIAGAIIDWRDSDDTVSTNGAETSTYSQYGYGAKNSDFETVDELRLVNGMTHDILYGPPPGQAPAEAAATTAGDWYLAHGIADYVTPWSTQPNTAADGTERVTINDRTRTDELRTKLQDILGTSRGGEIAARINANTPEFESKWDFYDRLLVRPEEIDQIDDFLTEDSQETTLKGRVNINTAPREVLLALGVLSEEEVDTLLTERPAAVAESPHGLGWVATALKRKSVDLAKLVCARGRQYSADIVAASGNGRGFRHVRIVVDTLSTPPRIVYRHDLTDNGWPLDPQILANLKSGKGVYGQAATGTTAGTGVR